MTGEAIPVGHGLTLDLARGCLTRGGEPVHLRPQSYEVLKLLVENAGRLLTKDALIARVWEGRAVTDGSLGKCIEEVRHALGPGVRHSLRNVRGRGYIFDPETDARSGVPVHATKVTTDPVAKRQELSIAVLPFANLSAEKENEYFSDGLAEEIINLLGRISGLRVIARTSAFAFKGLHEDIRRIAEAMNVTNVLEGSVRRAGNRLRVTAQLIAANDGSHLWSERYDRELSDVFAIQDEIAQAIATALQVKLAAPSQYKPSLPAYEALLRGRYHRQKFTPDAHARGTECFKQAIALDPGYAAPHAELGLNYLLSVTNAVHTLTECAPLIRAEARTALELDPSEPSSHLLLGAVAAAHDYDWKGADDHFAKAMSTGAVSAEAHWCYANYYLRAMGLRQQAVEQMQRAVDQDPLNVTWRAIQGHLLSTAEEYGRAIGELHKALQLDESHWLPNFVLAETYLVTESPSTALPPAKKAYRAHPLHSMTWGILAAVLTRLGEESRAAVLIRQHGKSPAPVWGRVLYHLFCDDIEEAANWYERMIQQREPFAVIFARDSVLKPLHASRHWPRLTRLMNLPEAV